MTTKIKGGLRKSLKKMTFTPSKSGNNIVQKIEAEDHDIPDLPTGPLPKPTPWYILKHKRRWIKVLDAICEGLSLPSAMMYLFFIAFGFNETPNYLWQIL